jgi:Cys-Gly metallodipeptidase DUG1
LILVGPWPKIIKIIRLGHLYGRGSSDDKGPIFGWINVLDAHHALNKPLPVNLRFCFEGMEESGSEGLDQFILAEVKKGKDSYFDGVDGLHCVCSPHSFL